MIDQLLQDALHKQIRMELLEYNSKLTQELLCYTRIGQLLNHLNQCLNARWIM